MRRITVIIVLSHNTMVVTNTGIAAFYIYLQSPCALSEMIYSRPDIYTGLGLGDTFAICTALHVFYCIQCKVNLAYLASYTNP